MWPNPQFSEDLVIFTEEIIDRKLHFLYSVTCDKFKSCTANTDWQIKLMDDIVNLVMCLSLKYDTSRMTNEMKLFIFSSYTELSLIQVSTRYHIY